MSRRSGRFRRRKEHKEEEKEIMSSILRLMKRMRRIILQKMKKAVGKLSSRLWGMMANRT